ncbi:MAG: hypothetical protein Q8T08_25810, partial [Ignavibacteria bacterium]|nr:hypothetical protein [Ignavibacteria bacterium]
MYASDPFWNVKIAGHAYRIDRYLGFKDFNAYQIGILDSTISSTLYKESNLTNTLYSINTRAKNYPFTIKASHNDTYYVQSTNPIVNNVVVTSSTTGLIPYNFDLSQAYINKNQVKLVNTPLTPVTVISDTDNLIVYASKFEWTSENQLFIKGYAALRNSNMNVESVTHTLKLTSLLDSEDITTYELDLTTPEFAINFLNGFDYTKAWFEKQIDISTLEPGYYKIEIVTIAGDTSGTSDVSNSDITAPKPLMRLINSSNYKFNFDNTERMRYELYIEKGLDFNLQETAFAARFYPVAFYDNFSIVDNILSIEGIAYQIGNTTNLASNVDQKLILLNNDGTQYVIELEESAGKYNYSNGGFDYSYAWFKGTVDLSDYPLGTYKMFILNSSNVNTDAIELRNYLNFEPYIVKTDTKKFTIESISEIKNKIVIRIE